MTERFHFPFSLSCIGEGNGNPLQCSCLENPRDGGAPWAAVYGVAQSQTWLTRLSSSSSRHLHELNFPALAGAPLLETQPIRNPSLTLWRYQGWTRGECGGESTSWCRQAVKLCTQTAWPPWRRVATQGCPLPTFPTAHQSSWLTFFGQRDWWGRGSQAVPLGQLCSYI